KYAGFLKTSSNWDVIDNSFQHGIDKIDLRLLDGGTGQPTQLVGAPAGQKLVWLGIQTTDAVAGIANSARKYGVWTDTLQGGHTNFVYVDTTGDGKADMKIQVRDAQATDF